MHLRTLGALKLKGSDLARYKPLLLLAYLALEGRQARRDVAELFWLGHKNPLSNLSMALSHLRKENPELIEADDTYVSANVGCDALDLLTCEDAAELKKLYSGAFLEGVFLNDWSAELEEWLYSQRERFAAIAQAKLLGLAETRAAQGRLREAAHVAEEAYRLRGAPSLAPEVLPRYYRLFAPAHHPYARKVRLEAEEFGVDLTPEVGVSDVLASPLEPLPLLRPSLPRPTTPLIGRDSELRQLLALMRRDDCRILTLTGLSGSGKTRLALELAHKLKQAGAFADGIYYIPLHGVTDFGEARRRGARVLGIPPVEVELSPNRIATFTGDKSLLFLLDDVDSTIEAAPALTQLLWTCQNAKFLVTSEERLRLPGEQVFPIGGLSFVLEDAQPKHCDAAIFFAERAARVKPDFALNAANLAPILKICELVEGSPLALELSAPWVKLFTLEKIAEEIEASLDFLQQDTRELLKPYQSMTAAFEHSWMRLENTERATLATLSLIETPFGMGIAEALSGAQASDLLKLHDKSSVDVIPGGNFYLSTLLRRFLSGKLAGDEFAPGFKDSVDRTFVDYFANVLKDAEDKITDQEHMSAVLADLEGNLPNLERAWQLCIEKDIPEFLRRAKEPLSSLFDFTGRWQTGINWYKKAIDWLEPQTEPESAELWGELTRLYLHLLLRAADFEKCLHHAEATLPRAQGQRLSTLEGAIKLTVSRLHTILGDVDAAKKALVRYRKLAEEDRELIIFTDIAIAELELLHGDKPSPTIFSPEDLKTLKRDDLALSNLFQESRFALRNGDLSRARRLMEECLKLAEELNYLSFSPFYFDTLALILHAQEDYETAEARAREGYELAKEETAKAMILGLEATLARILPHTDKPEEAHKFLQWSTRVTWSKGIKPVVLKNVVSFAEQCVVSERFEAAAQALQLALAHPATMRIEHPLIEHRLKGLKGKVPAKLKTISLDELVKDILEA